MPAEAGARVVGSEAERLGCGGIDDLEDIDPHAVSDDLHLIDETNVDRSVDVFEQFRHFCRLGRTDRNKPVDGLSVKRQAGPETGWRMPPDHFRDRRRGEIRIGRILSFRRIDGKYGFANLETPTLQTGNDLFLRRARIGGAFKRNHLAAAKMRRNLFTGIDDKAQVGFAILVERCRHADDDAVCLFDPRKVCGRSKARLAGSQDARIVDVLDGALSAVQLFDEPLRDIETENPVASLHVAKCERLTDVSKSYNANDGRLVGKLLDDALQ